MTERPFTVTATGLTLHGVLWQILRGATARWVAATLDRNPGLAAEGPFLPLGREIVLVLPGADDEVEYADVVDLWDVDK